MSEMNFDLLTVEKVAEILHISKQKVNTLIKSSDLPVIMIGPRSRRIAVADLEKYIKSSKLHDK